MIHLHTYIACRTRAVEDRCLHIVHTGERTATLLTADTKIGLGNLGERGETGLECILVAFKFYAEISSQWHVSESTDEDSLGAVGGVGRNGIRQLVDVAEKASLEQLLHHRLPIEFCRVFHPEIMILLLLVGFHLDTKQFSAISPEHSRHRAADRRRKPYVGRLLVNKQGVAGFYLLSLFDYHFGHHSGEVLWHEREIAVSLHGHSLRRGFPFEVDVQAFA